ncbi:MAG TPA: hypothetical protein VHB27_20045 [Rhodopila sp.]|uniref:hypothetical protein n=1 Tax=Rhodopila sp. TaxID=2480087 RepID=UPI002CE17F42|nr:hypothetical protein [Rhodopila sp.]HVY17524.1 hypothetical protein [Rhodopila sp.]
MNAAASPKTAPAHGFREVRGAFARSEDMQDAVRRLSVSGFDRADMTLPTDTALPPADTDLDAQQLRTLRSSTAATAAALAAAGITVATGGAAAPAAVAAVAAGGAAGGAAYAAQEFAEAKEQASRDDRAEHGRLVLAVRTPTAAQQTKASDILRAAGATEVETFE